MNMGGVGIISVASNIVPADVAGLVNAFNKGDKQKAIEYYQKAITLVDIKQPLSGDDIKHYQSKIQLLGGAN